MAGGAEEAWRVASPRSRRGGARHRRPRRPRPSGIAGAANCPGRLRRGTSRSRSVSGGRPSGIRHWGPPAAASTRDPQPSEAERAMPPGPCRSRLRLASVAPMDPARFVTDSSLAFLARRLRFLGYDVLVAKGARLEELLELGRAEGRVVLTTSARHPRRYADVSSRSLPRTGARDLVRAIASDSEPAGAPFSRCPECNVALQRRHAFEARGEVPGRVLRAAQWLTHCPSCGKCYWEGSHVARLRAWLEDALGRPLPSS